MIDVDMWTVPKFRGPGFAKCACLMSAMALAWFGAIAQLGGPTGVVITTGVQPMVDASLISQMHDLQHRLHEPIRREVALTLDRPWEGIMSGYGVVMRDEAAGEFRMYYRGGGDIDPPEVTCLAVSADGITWERPELSLFTIDGITTNNVVWTAARPSYGESHNFFPFIDANPASASDARYKAVGLMIAEDDTGERRKMLGAWASPDGLRWRLLSDAPVIRNGSFDSLNVAFWDPYWAKYVCYSRVGQNGLRSIQWCASFDFLNWSEPEPLDFAPGQTEQYYTNGVTLYPRTPRLYLAMPMRFVPERKSVGHPPRETDGLSDAVLLTSRDGRLWRRTFRQAFLRPGLDPDNWGEAHGNMTPLTGLLQTGENELSMYWFEGYVSGTPRIRRGTLRLDGFASLHAGADDGEMITAPLTIMRPEEVTTGGTPGVPGDASLTGESQGVVGDPANALRLVLNCSTSALGSIRVELQDASGRALPGFALADCEPVWGDDLARPVMWNGGDAMPSTGKPIRMRFVLRDADLFAFEIK